jgi:ankyrin repeat protein
MMACESGYHELVDLLVSSAGEKILKYNHDSGSPLHAAITGKKPIETIEALLSFYYDSFDMELDEMVNLKDQAGTHPLYLAVFHGNHDAVRLLL